MAFTNFCARSGGSNLNAGTLTGDTTEPGTAASFTYAGGTFVRATGVFTVASGNPQTDGVAVGDFASVYTTAGATQPGIIARVTARDTTTITVTVAANTFAGAVANVSETGGATTLKIGGAWEVPQGSTAFPWGYTGLATALNSNSDPVRVNLKDNGSEFNITAALTHNVPGPIFWEGYTSSYGDGGFCKFYGDSASPSAPYTMLTISSAATGNFYQRLWFDDNGGTTPAQSVGNNTMVDNQGTGSRFEGCRFTNAYRFGLRGAGGGSFYRRNEFYLNNRDDAQQFGQAVALEESDWTGNTFYNSTYGVDSSGLVLNGDNTENITVTGNIFYNHSGSAIECVGNHNSFAIYGNLFHTCLNGVEFIGAVATSSNLIIENNIFWNVTNDGVATANANHRSGPLVRTNAFGDVGGADVDALVNTSFVSGSVQITVDPCMDAANGDFRLNNTAGGGAVCRGAGLSTFLINTAVLSSGASTVGFPDLGAVQHEDAAPAGGQTSYTFG